MGETLDDSGELTLRNIQCITKGRPSPLQELDYTCREGVNEYTPKFYYGGFQYAQVDTDVEFRTEDFTAVAVYSAFEETSKFECSNRLISQFYHNTLWSLKSNSTDVPTDCPTRERMGWTGDSQVFFNTASYLTDYAAFARKHVRDIFDRQWRSGRLPQIAPFANESPSINKMNGSVGWACAGVYIPYYFYQKYGDDRLTEIQDVEDEIDIEDLIEEEDCCYTLSNAGYIKRLPVDTYRTQRRGGRGVSGQSLKEEDYVKNLFIASTHDYVLFFTNTGRVHRKKGYLIPEAGRTARGTNIVNILPLEQGERVTAMLLTREFTDHEYLMMVTRGGTVKRIRLDALYTARKAGIRALSLDDGDELIAVLKTNGSDNILLATRQGMAICFAETDVRPMGRDAAGVRGIRLDDGDEVVSAAVAAEGKSLLTVTENGYGKRTAVESYLRGEDRQPQTRGGKGLRNYRLTEKTGLVAGAAIVDDTNDVMLIESGGVVLRTPAASINLYGRDTQGVILMRIEEGNRVIGVEAISNTEETEESGED